MSMTCLLCANPMVRDLEFKRIGFDESYTIACSCNNYSVNFEGNGNIASETIVISEMIILRTLFDTHVLDMDFSELLFFEYHVKDLKNLCDMAINARIIK